jgi:soluble lytic murein transglycosylase-like protein
MIKLIIYIILLVIIGSVGIHDHRYDDTANITDYNRQREALAREEERNRLRNLFPYHDIVYDKAKKYEIEPSLVFAIIKVESSGKSGAISRKGAKGLMQLMPATARQMNVKNPLNPEENIEGGVKYLRHLLDRFNGDVSNALAAYNAGPRRVRKFGGIPPIRETQQYVNKVLSLYIDSGPQSEKLFM